MKVKTLIVYYSKSGTTRRVAEEIAKTLNGDIEEIIEVGVCRSGFLGYVRAGRDGMRGRTSPIEPAKRRPSDYDLVLIGSPVWGWNLVPAVRSYLGAADLNGKPVGFFCTMASSGEKKTFESMRELAVGARPVGELVVVASELRSQEAFTTRIASWAKEMAAATGK